MKVTGKIILCRCEDVTLKDVEDSIAHGYADIEEVKRYTGFGTGPCQGKECLSVVAALVAERTGGAHGGAVEVLPFTSRPPLAPTPLKHYAALAALGPPGDHDHGGDHDDDDHPPAPAPGRATRGS
jgi:bacterioferritin-associated ferredoxin